MPSANTTHDTVTLVPSVSVILLLAVTPLPNLVVVGKSEIVTAALAALTRTGLTLTVCDPRDSAVWNDSNASLAKKSLSASKLKLNPVAGNFLACHSAAVSCVSVRV